MLSGKIIAVYCEGKYETNKLQCARRTQESYNAEARGICCNIALKFKKGYWNLMLRIQRRKCDQLCGTGKEFFKIDELQDFEYSEQYGLSLTPLPVEQYGL